MPAAARHLPSVCYTVAHSSRRIGRVQFQESHWLIAVRDASNLKQETRHQACLLAASSYLHLGILGNLSAAKCRLPGPCGRATSFTGLLGCNTLWGEWFSWPNVLWHTAFACPATRAGCVRISTSTSAVVIAYQQRSSSHGVLHDIFLRLDQLCLAWRLCNARAPCGATVEPKRQSAPDAALQHTPARHCATCISICAVAEHPAVCPAA